MCVVRTLETYSLQLQAYSTAFFVVAVIFSAKSISFLEFGAGLGRGLQGSGKAGQWLQGEAAAGAPTPRAALPGRLLGGPPRGAPGDLQSARWSPRSPRTRSRESQGGSAGRAGPGRTFSRLLSGRMQLRSGWPGRACREAASPAQAEGLATRLVLHQGTPGALASPGRWGRSPGPAGERPAQTRCVGPDGRYRGRQGIGLQRGGMRARRGEACTEVCGPTGERPAERWCAGPAECSLAAQWTAACGLGVSPLGRCL